MTTHQDIDSMPRPNRYPLRVRFANDEWATRVLDMARCIVNRPVFAETSFEDILCFFDAMIPSLIEVHLMSSITFNQDPTGWTGYTDNLVINEFALGCDLTSAAYERFILGHTPSLPSSSIPMLTD